MAGKPIFENLNAFHQIITGDTKAGGVQNAASKAAETLKTIKTFEDSFFDSIQDAAKRLKIDGNCGENLMNWVGNLPYAGPVVGGLNFVKGSSLDVRDGLSYLGGKFLTPESMAGNICFFTNKWMSIIDFYVNLALSSAVMLFKLIDGYKTRLEKALMEFMNDVKGCLVSSLRELKELTGVRKATTSFLDFGVLEELMVKCPCIEEILGNMFGGKCFEENKGNPAAIVRCLENIGIDAVGALDITNRFLDKILKEMAKAFNETQKFLKRQLDRILRPLRNLIKQYCALLTKKLDMTTLIGMAKRNGFDCLFIYSIEKRRNGTEYPGMSILDMIKTFKLWANCFEHVCTSFSDDLKRKIKDYNEGLRLNPKFWNDPNSIDIFLACLFFKSGSSSPRSSMIREIYTRQKPLNAKSNITEVLDVYKALGKITAFDDIFDDEVEEKNAVADAVVNSDGLEEKTLTGNGDLLFKKNIEKLIIAMTKNIGNAAGSDSYEDKFSELTEWEFEFVKSQNHLDALNIVNEKFKNTIYSTEETDSRTIDEEISPVLPSYEIVDDYSELRSTPKPEQGENETDLDYYTRWFNLQT